MIHTPVLEKRMSEIGDSVAVVDMNQQVICIVPDSTYSLMVAAAINNFLSNHTRNKDPQTSRTAEQSMEAALKNRLRKTVVEMFQTFGPMSDEQLAGRFELGGINVTEARVRHLRLELQRLGIVEHKTKLTANTRSGSKCNVYGLAEGKING